MIYTDSVDPNPVTISTRLPTDPRHGAGQVDSLIIIGGNPVFNAPADMAFAEQMAEGAARIHLAFTRRDLVSLALAPPEAHYLESWSDARAYDGTVSIVQPLIAPLYGGKSAHELVAALLREPTANSSDIVRAFWQGEGASSAPAARPAVRTAACHRPGSRCTMPRGVGTGQRSCHRHDASEQHPSAANGIAPHHLGGRIR